MLVSARFVAVALILVVLAGCASRRAAPVIDRRPDQPAAGTPVETSLASDKPADTIKLHVVQKGETLIAIALQYGLDYRELAGWNNIENVNVIRVGQELRVNAPGAIASGEAVVTTQSGTVVTPLLTTASPTGADARPPANTATLKVEPRAVKVPYSDKALAQLEAEARLTVAASTPSAIPTVPVAPVTPAPALKVDDESVDWGWPAKGKVLAAYTDASKGMDISGSLGAPVLATASGKVVYSGTGLRGYGKLVIIKHNNSYLSAYAHNNNILVKEGQDVKKGQKIAEMGSSDTDQVKLHFEIRKQGKPVDPSKYLPPG